MMTVEAVSERLSSLRGRLDQLGVGRVFLIGSRARGDAHEASDFDFVVDFVKPATIDSYQAVQSLLEEALSSSIDFLTLEYIREDKKAYIMSEARQVA